MFYDINDAELKAYNSGFSISDLFNIKSTRIITAKDNLAVDFTKEKFTEKLERFLDNKRNGEEVRKSFSVRENRQSIPRG